MRQRKTVEWEAWGRIRYLLRLTGLSNTSKVKLERDAPYIPSSTPGEALHIDHTYRLLRRYSMFSQMSSVESRGFECLGQPCETYGRLLYYLVSCVCYFCDVLASAQATKLACHREQHDADVWSSCMFLQFLRKQLKGSLTCLFRVSSAHTWSSLRRGHGHAKKVPAWFCRPKLLAAGLPGPQRLLVEGWDSTHRWRAAHQSSVHTAVKLLSQNISFYNKWFCFLNTYLWLPRVTSFPLYTASYYLKGPLVFSPKSQWRCYLLYAAAVLSTNCLAARMERVWMLVWEAMVLVIQRGINFQDWLWASACDEFF